MAGKTISFINMKGGVGKTTLAINVAYTLSKVKNKKVLLIDMDPQMNATQYALSEAQVEEIMKDKNKSVYGFLTSEYKTNSTQKEYLKDENVECIFTVDGIFDIIPSDLNIMRLNLTDTPFKLRQYIQEKLSDKYEIIIIDCPPTISAYTKVALLASDMYIVPMKADTLSLFGLPMLQTYIAETISGEFQHEIDFIGIVLNMVSSSRLLYKKTKPKIVSRWKNKLFSNELSLREEIVKGLDPSLSTEKYIIDMNEAKIVDQMKNITNEILQKGRI